MLVVSARRIDIDIDDDDDDASVMRNGVNGWMERLYVGGRGLSIVVVPFVMRGRCWREWNDDASAGFGIPGWRHNY